MVEHIFINLEDELFPVSAFFSTFPKSRWPEILQSFCQGIGWTYNDASCELPCEDLSEDEAAGGIAFSLFEDEVLLEVEQFLEIVRKVCDEYLKTNGSEKDHIESLYFQLCENARQWEI